MTLADGTGMPDFVSSTTGSEFTNRFRDQILSYDRKYSSGALLYQPNKRSGQNEKLRPQHVQGRNLRR